MTELLEHFIDAWSAPGDLWNPDKIIAKVESMLQKEKDALEQAWNDGHQTGRFEGKGIAEEGFQDFEMYYKQITNQEI